MTKSGRLGTFLGRRILGIAIASSALFAASAHAGFCEHVVEASTEVGAAAAVAIGTVKTAGIKVVPHIKAVPHSSGGFILSGRKGYIAGTLGKAGTVLLAKVGAMGIGLGGLVIVGGAVVGYCYYMGD